LLGWDGSKDLPEFRRLVEDIAAIVGAPVTEHAEAKRAEKQESKLKPGTIFRDKLKGGSQGPEMVVIPAGTFKMGDIQDTGRDLEKPVHTVSIAKSFAIGRYPITFDEYDEFASATSRPLPNDYGWGRGRQPAIEVSWDDAVEYTKWLSEQTGERYRLPTEAEWEYAARAGTETEYGWGNEMKAGMANCKGGDSRWGGKQTSPVGSFQPNPFGLYDTAGNVWEWVEDCWHENYKGAPTHGSAWLEANASDCGLRVNTGRFLARHSGFLACVFPALGQRR
jgi:formylglycine-generating enzyme required for sulfatase activity